MKILCVSDQIDPLVYNQNAKNIFSDVDVILCAGDLPMNYVDFIVTVFNKPVFFVFGNHDLKEFRFYNGRKSLKYSYDTNHSHGGTHLGFTTYSNKNLTYIDENGRETPLLIAGAGGSLRYNNGQNQYTDRQMKWKLIRMIPQLMKNKRKYGRYLDILLTHATPRHVHDHEDPCHKGFDCFNWFIEKFRPKYLVHGHIHLYDIREKRVSRVMDTTVVNAYAHYVINLPETQENDTSEETQ